MMRALNTSATGMVAQQYNLDVISNNLANVNTTAYKEQRPEFQDLMYQTFRSSGAPTGANTQQPVDLQVGLGTQFSSTATDFSEGNLQSTGNALDMAINGVGFFKVKLPDGSFAYTRDGSFKSDSSGSLVTSEGYQLDPAVKIPANSTAITVGLDGTVSVVQPGNANPSTVGNIKITSFPNPAGLNRIGQNLYTVGGASGDPNEVNPGTEGTGQIQSTFLEGSNVQVVQEMVNMITAQRAYEINSKAIQTADDMLNVINSLKPS